MPAPQVGDGVYLRVAAASRLSMLGNRRREAAVNQGRDGEELLARMQARHSIDPKHSLMQRLSRLASALGPFERKEFSPGFVERIREEAAGRKIYYVSTPVTGGKRLYDFLAEKGKKSVRELDAADKDEFIREVIEKNCAAAADLADRWRDDDTLVVDPSRLAVKQWQQAEYLNHWLDVVDVATAVVLQDGWELSEGCVHEARAAFEHGLEVMDARGQKLTREAAIRNVDRALDLVRQKGFEPLNLSEILQRSEEGEAEVPEPRLFVPSKLVSPLTNSDVESYPLAPGELEDSVPRVAMYLTAACDAADQRTRQGVPSSELVELETRLVESLDREPPEAVDALETILAKAAEKLDGGALPAGYFDCGNGVFTLNLHEVAKNKQAFLGDQVGLLVVDTTPGHDGMNYYIQPVGPDEVHPGC